MKRTCYYIISIALAIMTGCAEDVQQAVPIAPLLKYIEMPSETAAIPGTNVTIAGKGFDQEDQIFCKSKNGEIDFTPEVVSVSNFGITIAVPVKACGAYEVSVTRKGLTTVLEELLNIPYVIALSDVVFPGAASQGESITIRATGLEAGDKIVFESDYYPKGVEAIVECTEDGIAIFPIPSTCYGVNTVKITRGKKIGTLGTIKIAVALFAKTAGGIVFYVSDNGVHGLVVHESALGDAAMNWGPAVPSAYAAGSKPDIYSGKQNSVGLLKQVADSKVDFPYPHATPVELCNDLVAVQDGISYDDWFLPSLNELVELFKVKSQVAEAGFTVPYNNYWSSTEFDYSGGWVWAMLYSNFYEATNIVTGVADRTGWAIGTLAIRQF